MKRLHFAFLSFTRNCVAHTDYILEAKVFLMPFFPMSGEEGWSVGLDFMGDPVNFTTDLEP